MIPLWNAEGPDDEHNHAVNTFFGSLYSPLKLIFAVINRTKTTMAFKSFLLNGFLSMMDVKQHLLMGTEMANCCDDSNMNMKEARSLDAGFADSSVAQNFYVNPVISENAPDPGVVRLADGSGWVAVATSDHSSKHSPDPRAFPMYFSKDLIHWEVR